MNTMFLFLALLRAEPTLSRKVGIKVTTIWKLHQDVLTAFKATFRLISNYLNLAYIFGVAQVFL
jgi:hypothetical protein